MIHECLKLYELAEFPSNVHEIVSVSGLPQKKNLEAAYATNKPP